MAENNSYKKYLKILWAIFLIPVFSLILVVVLVSFGALGKLPSFEELENPQSNLATEIYSSDGKLLGKFYYENRVNVKFQELDSNLVHALIATEDARFYDHSGVDGRGLVRVITKTLIGGDQSSGGGSTITQQLAKMLFPRERGQSKFKLAFRKIKEWVIAAKLEKQYTKEEILTMYLNKFDFVNNAVGIKSAAKIYFNATPDSLSLEQCAMLVGMAKNPALFNPVRRPDTTMHRRNVVMNQMVRYGYLSKQQYDSLKVLPLALDFHAEDHNEGLAPYFREYLRDVFMDKWLEENKKPDGTDYNLYRDGLKIYTTIDSRLQKYGEEAVREHLKDFQALFNKDLKQKKNAPFAWNVTKQEIASIMKSSMKRSERYRVLKQNGMNDEEIEKSFHSPVKMTVFSWEGEIDTTMTPWDSMKYYKGFLQTGFMSMDPHTGYIKAWVGGINHKHFKYDHVKVGRRQVGSTFKPFVYALAIQEGYSPCYKLPNVRTCIDLPDGTQWCPDNSDVDKWTGKQITLQRALALSVNYVSAYLIKQFGPEAVVNIARRLGIQSPIDAVPAICLGTPELTLTEIVAANAAFANKGTWTEPIFVTRIEDKHGRILQEFYPKTEEVFSEEKAFVMLALMKGVVQYGTGASLRFRYKINAPVAGKTGTTQNQSDGWFMGITPDLVSGCWVGAEDRSVHFNTLEYGQGARMALPIWARYMNKVYSDKRIKISQGDFEKPAKKIDVEMDCSRFDEVDTAPDFDNGEL